MWRLLVESVPACIYEYCSKQILHVVLPPRDIVGLVAQYCDANDDCKRWLHSTQE